MKRQPQFVNYSITLRQKKQQCSLNVSSAHNEKDVNQQGKQMNE